MGLRAVGSESSDRARLEGGWLLLGSGGSLRNGGLHCLREADFESLLQALFGFGLEPWRSYLSYRPAIALF